MRRAYKFRLYPNANQSRELGIMLETHRRLYNLCLEQRRGEYETHRRSVRYADQSSEFKDLRGDNPFFARLNFSSAQATMRRLDKAYTAFFRRCKTGGKPGYPRFRSRDRYDSIEFPAYGDGIRLSDNRLRVQHVGLIKTKVHREVVGTVKTATLKREADKWYVVLSCDLGDVAVPPNGKPAIGIDVGIESFLTTSDGEHLTNPRYLKCELPSLRVAQRTVSRRKRGGRNRNKAAARVKTLHARVANLRREHHHQVALQLVRSCGLIGVERLNIQGMLKNHSLARAIADAGWSSFGNILRYKAESAGAEVVEVVAAGTSQECSGCGVVVRKPLSQRMHTCPECGLVLHRDVNAARNILARALLARMGPAGRNTEIRRVS
jgi:putative transposase